MVEADKAAESSWASSFAEDAVFEDLYFAEPAVGRSAIAARLREAALPKGSRLVLDRVSDGQESCGFTWHILDSADNVGQRGVSFVAVNKAGEVSYVRDVGEPLFKPGILIEKFLAAITKDQPPPSRPSEAAVDKLPAPKAAGDVVRMLYGPVQQQGGNALRFFSDDVVYEDMNYDQPFLGKAAVAEFLARFQTLQGVTFSLERVSDGKTAVGFTYNVVVAGQSRGIRGATFYEVNPAGEACYVRDVPESAMKPPPVQAVWRQLRPGLRRSGPATPLPGDIAGKDPLLAS